MTDTAATADPSATTPAKKQRKRKTIAERRAEMREQLAKLEAQEAKASLEEAIKAGECHDPAAAKLLQKEIRYLTAARSTMEKYDLCSAENFISLMEVLNTRISEAVDGPSA